MRGIYLAALVLMAPWSAAMADTVHFTSIYTNLSGCQVMEEPGQARDDWPDGYFLDRCPGRDGYAVYVEGGGDRSWPVFSKGATRISLQGTGEGDVYFPLLATSKLEWRYRVVGTEKQLVAVIFRMVGQHIAAAQKGDAGKTASFLYVLRLTEGRYCVLGKATTNEAARQLADSNAGCSK